MYLDLKDKTALVTGAGKRSGIGYAIARQLAACGTHVIITDLGRFSPAEALDGSTGAIRTASEDEMTDIAQELADAFSVSTLAVSVDVADPTAIAEMVENVKRRFDHIDILCNNAGASFGVPNAVHTYDESAWMKTIDVNLHGVFRVSRAVLPLMMGRKGSIVNTASRAGKVPPLFNGAYAVAKAGVIMLTKVMARELATAGIRVNAVCPGQIMTDLEKWRFELEAKVFNTTVEAREAEMCKSIPLGRIGEPQEVAHLVTYLASEVSGYTTGQAINVTGGQLMEV
ncbi:MAG: SDR family NAD(P)-dependent oxidoreductase [Deltaproteobacteria bacterium]|nr:SDR family NAD(P)-dependent oxidoreductase [Deltaproteobacteria bacterium]